jgi:Kef-type K+ transport system membrane component KefB
MESIFLTATLWLALAIVSALIASSLRLSIALIEICVGVVAAAATEFFHLGDVLAADSEWVKFLAASGAVVLTFLAGAELDPDIVRRKLTEVSVVGLVGFMTPFLGCAAVAHYLTSWDGTRMPVGSAASPSPPPPWRWSMPSCWKLALIRQSLAKESWHHALSRIWER